MARTSKKKRKNTPLSGRRFSQKVYFAGIYARLSVEKDERKNESIETQIEIAKAFAREREDIIISGCYTDV